MAQDTDTPFHAGEIEIQERYGVREKIGGFAKRVVRDHLTAEHTAFFRQLPFLVLGSVDAEGQPWASIVTGPAGFLSTPDPRTLRVAAQPLPGDPLAEALSEGRPIGGLGIEFETRRRNRFTAHVAARTEGAVDLRIDQSFGNCPQYILTRAPVRVEAPATAAPEHLAALDPHALALIRGADTFFVATAAPEDGDIRHGADVSHRGGKPGFVRVGADGRLTVPDFAGNLHFNTLGNLMLDPRAGLLFADFATGDLLFVAGTVEVQFEGPEIAAFQGAERLWHLTPSRAIRLRGALPLRFAGGEASPNALITGDWETAEARLAAEARRTEWRPWRVAEIRAETDAIRSLVLEPADGGGRPGFEAGQFLPIRLEVGGEVLTRTYTVSSAPEDARLRLSVKRDGRMSEALHRLEPGDRLEAQAPRGGFTLDAAERRPAVLLSAGIGITPMLSMLRHAVIEGARTRHTRPIYFLHQARSVAERAFHGEIEALAARVEAIRAVWALSRPEPEARPGADYQVKGRIDLDVLKQLLPFDDHDFYLCGPAAFVQGLYDGLRDLGVRDARIFAESFGPSALLRRADAAAAPAPVATGTAEVRFAKTGARAEWTPEAGTLLEFAEAQGLEPASGCRSGGCGACAVTVDGPVKYLTLPTAPVGPGEALICCAVPDAPEDGPAAEVTLAL